MACKAHLVVSTVQQTPIKKRRRNITDGIATHLPPRKMIKIISVVSDQQIAPENIPSPQHVLESILSSKGIAPIISSYDHVREGFFVPATEQEINAWDFDIVRAIRDCDIDKLREFHRSGHPLSCSNKFGERLLHIACRKGSTAVVDFLVNEVGVPVQVTDDTGRTPLHDSFWSAEPNFDVIDMILKKSIDLLHVKDRRGHTPLDYTRKAHWGEWGAYLKSRSDIIIGGYSNFKKPILTIN